MAVMRIPAALVAALLGTLLSALPFAGAAAPFSVRLGIEKLVLDTPPGFTDTIELASPRLTAVSESLTPASNRILIFALSDDDVRRFTLGDPVDIKRYMIAVTPKGLEHQRISPEMFNTHVGDSLQNLGAQLETPDLIKFLEKEPIGKAYLLAELKREPGTVSVLQASRLPDRPATTFWGSPTPRYLCYTTTLFLVRGKMLQIRVYSFYDTPDDIDWLKVITQRWQDELLRLNR
jgi:hypothetical protein